MSPSRLSSYVIRRNSAWIYRTFSAWALDRRPCLVLAAATRALPSAVLGPVDLPPCIRHLLRSVTTGFWQGVPWRVLARHLCPGQWGPSRVPRPASISFFRSVKVNILRPPARGLASNHYTAKRLTGVTWLSFGTIQTSVSYRIFWDHMIAHVNIRAKPGPSPCLRNRAP